MLPSDVVVIVVAEGALQSVHGPARNGVIVLDYDWEEGPYDWGYGSFHRTESMPEDVRAQVQQVIENMEV